MVRADNSINVFMHQIGSRNCEAILLSGVYEPPEAIVTTPLLRLARRL